jgi:Xaa-Pro aminopeptidase
MWSPGGWGFGMTQTYEARRARLRRLLSERGLDGLLVTSLVNVRYLTGFLGSNAALLVPANTSAPVVLATDTRYAEAAEQAFPELRILVERDTAPALAARAERMRLLELGFESHHLTVDGYNAVREAAADARFQRTDRIVEVLRAVKDAVEIEALRAACAVADAAFSDVLPNIRPGVTELTLAADLESRMRRHGSEAPSFDTIVAGGEHAAVPHHRPTDRPVRLGDFVKFDFGAVVAGYHSDMTRTVVLGEPADWQRDVYDVVARAQQAGVDEVTDGIATSLVDRASRRVVEAAGMGERFLHGLGHGVGLEIHEAPALGTGSAGALATSMVVTVEPGVYLAGRGGVRIEDTLVVHAAGTPAERLTLTTRELLVL